MDGMECRFRKLTTRTKSWYVITIVFILFYISINFHIIILRRSLPHNKLIIIFYFVISRKKNHTAAIDFIDAMDVTNYVIVDVSKPMGIVFEENDADFGGIFVQSLKEGGNAFVDGRIREGDQLVGVDTTKVSGMPFDDALGAIVESANDKVKLTFFRGNGKQLYGPTGASQKWIEDFITSSVSTSST